MIEIKVPDLGESIDSATIGSVLKKAGDFVKKDELIAEIETDKVVLEICAPAAGTIAEIKFKSQDIVKSGETFAMINTENAGSTTQTPASTSATQPVASESKTEDKKNPSPSAEKMIQENKLNSCSISGSGKDGQVLKHDVMDYLSKPQQTQSISVPTNFKSTKEFERVKMSKLRQTIAKRLKDSQNNAAILTTFNELDMSYAMDLRSKYKDLFEKKHGAKLGFMSFFTKAVVAALKEIPSVNAEIDGQDIIYKNFYDIGVAVGTEQGLVVPVIQDCDKLSMAAIEQKIAEYGKKAREGKLSIAEMQGGTFTISNGGVYGSLLSTPIINPPQSGILGLHNIVKRPVVVNDQIVIRPMMYIALSYDHRIIDGKEAVTFLVRVKEFMENPARLLLEI